MFEQLMMQDATGWASAKFRFHCHQWPSSTHISVSMERGDALTVSRTFIEVSSRVVDLWYEAVGCSAQLVIRAA